MLNKELYVDILALHRQGQSIRSIARNLNISRNTVRKYIKNKDLPAYTPREKRGSKLDPFKGYLLGRIDAAKPHWIPATVLFGEITTKGYDGSLSLLRGYLREFKHISKEPVIRFETSPGEQLQIDFTVIKRGKQTLKAFVATLGYSRACFVKFYDNEKTNAWIDGLTEAFYFFGGVPKQVLCDNAKAIVIERNRYGEGNHKWNDKMLELSVEYGFQLKACKPYRAKTKGKVERFNHYLKNSFIVPLAASLKQSNLTLDVSIANAKVGPWLADIAHQRIHGTTKKQPSELLVIEQENFLPLPQLVHNNIPKDEYETIQIVPPANFNSFQHPMSVYEEVLS